MIILGIDPGTAITGYGLINKENNKLKLIQYGCITTETKFSTGERLSQLDQKLKKIITQYRPRQIAVEDIFFFKNVKTAIKVSQARGVILSRAANMKIPILEYTPLQIKQATTSYGRAEKIQVQRMVKLLLGLDEIPKPDDAADALAAAICCAHTLR